MISSGDAKQLPAVTGQCIWSSIQMITEMQILQFKCDVCARDVNLQFLNSECRRNLDRLEAEIVADCLLDNCVIVASWSDVPDNVVRIVSTRAAEKKVMDEFLVNKVTRDFAAVDEVQNNTSWVPAADHVSRRLDGAVYEYA